jgi:DNA repair exonuclease SbcCD nuclease subunit
MIVLVTADLHLTDKVRDTYRHVAMKTILDLIKVKRPKQLIILGDLTEQKNYHSAELTNAVVDHLYEFSQWCEVIVDLGNHDYTSIDCPFFKFLSHISNITWVGKPCEPLGLRRTLILPHTSNYKRDWKGLDFGQYDWIFAHQTFSGAISDSGHKLEDVPLSVFPKGSQVISGDIHTPQKVGCVTYCGAPYIVDFGDDYSPRVLLLTPQGVKSIPVPGVQKRLVEVAAGQKLTDDAWSKISGLNRGDILKVRVHITSKQKDQWQSIRESILGWGQKWGYVVHAVQPIMKQEQTHVGQIRHDRRSDRKVLADFAGQNGVDELTVKTGMKLLEAV